ncbi:MAG: Gfo/Idh/MocA family oxidoreductase [Oscillospiraceae bacterium]|nr:Gfo/Idh/MocA family oxidoreductase [Oscillospiraceae bacterium]
MFKVAILGCENSHANAFLSEVLTEKLVDDVEFIGVYSDDRTASEKLNEKFGVPVMDRYDELVGQVDGIVITARHGDNHFKFAKPYLSSGIPMFIDKPITCSIEDAVAFRAALEANKIPVAGGSTLAIADMIQKLKKDVAEAEPGQVIGGFFCAPIVLNSVHGGFFFYAQHLVQMMTTIYGTQPRSVKVFEKKDVLTCVVRYDDLDVTLTYIEAWKESKYVAYVNYKGNFVGEVFYPTGLYGKEFMEFYRLLKGEPQAQSYEEFFAPVYIMNAIEKSRLSGKEEPIEV